MVKGARSIRETGDRTVVTMDDGGLFVIEPEAEMGDYRETGVALSWVKPNGRRYTLKVPYGAQELLTLAAAKLTLLEHSRKP